MNLEEEEEEEERKKERRWKPTASQVTCLLEKVCAFPETSHAQTLILFGLLRLIFSGLLTVVGNITHTLDCFLFRN